MFADPNLIGKLKTNPKTAKLLDDPAFVAKLQMMQTNPGLASSLLGSDPRMIQVLGALMGVDMQGFSGDNVPDDIRAQAEASPSSPPPKPQSPPPKPAAAEPPQEDVEMEEVDEEEAKAKKEALEAKAAGAAAYKAKDFETAATHFSKAWDLWPKDITFLTNLGGKCTLLPR